MKDIKVVPMSYTAMPHITAHVAAAQLSGYPVMLNKNDERTVHPEPRGFYRLATSSWSGNELGRISVCNFGTGRSRCKCCSSAIERAVDTGRNNHRFFFSSE